MKIIGVTQRVEPHPRHPERRDLLDQRWAPFLHRVGALPWILPNHPETARAALGSVEMAGILLTGGNTPAAYGGDAPERDRTEELCIRWAVRNALPLLGVCRGMQMIQHHFGVRLRPVAGHVAPRMTLRVEGVPTELNSYHTLGATECPAPLVPWATADDGTVKAVRHRELPIAGIMWHPERIAPFRAWDIGYFRQLFDIPGPPAEREAP